MCPFFFIIFKLEAVSEERVKCVRVLLHRIIIITFFFFLSDSLTCAAASRGVGAITRNEARPIAHVALDYACAAFAQLSR